MSHSRRALVALALVAAIAAVTSSSEDPEKPLTEKILPSVDLKKQVFQYLFEKTGRRPAGRAVPPETPWIACWREYKANEKNPRALYFAISEHLAIVDNRYFKSEDGASRLQGLGMSVEAAKCALKRLQDTELAVMIAQAYIPCEEPRKMLCKAQVCREHRRSHWLQRSEPEQGSLCSWASQRQFKASAKHDQRSAGRRTFTQSGPGRR